MKDEGCKIHFDIHHLILDSRPAAKALVTEASRKGLFSMMCDGGNDKWDKNTLVLWPCIEMTAWAR